MPPRAANQNVRQTDVSSQPAARDKGAARVADALDDTGSRTLRRGLQVLDAVLASGRDGARVIDLCRAAALERATVYRLLATLVEEGYVARSGRFRYAAGPRLSALAEDPGTPNMAARLQPALVRVSAATGDAAFAVVREGGSSHCIARQVGTHPVQILVIQVGTRQPLGVGAAGLALLAALDEGEAKRIIDGNAAVLGAYGGMTPERLRILVRATRERGWSVIGNHATRGVLAVGMAVRNSAGEPVAGISVASTLARMPRERQAMIARWMRQALSAVSVDGGLQAQATRRAPARKPR